MRRILGIASMVGLLRGARNGPNAAAGHVGRMSGSPESTGQASLLDHPPAWSDKRGREW